jgi:small-conductance mechanosensitive channel
MEQAELFTNLAAIAGIFVGFGALISIRSERARDEEVMMIRMIVLFGIQVVIAALVPVMLSGYGVTGHGLWVTSSWVFLVLWWGSSILNRWDTERIRVLAAVDRRQRMWKELPAVPLWLSMNGALILILTGMFPDQEPALYATAVMMNLFLNAGMLVYLVYLQPRSGSDRRETASPESHVDLPTPAGESRPIA